MTTSTYQTQSWTGSRDSVPTTESANRPSFTPSSPHIQHHPGLWWHGLSTGLSGWGRTTLVTRRAVVSEHWITCRNCSPLVYTTVLIHVPSHSFRHYTFLPCRKIPLQTDLRAGDETRPPCTGSGQTATVWHGWQWQDVLPCCTARSGPSHHPTQHSTDEETHRGRVHRRRWQKKGGRFEQSANCTMLLLKSSGHECPGNRQCHRAVVAQPPPTSSLPTPQPASQLSQLQRRQVAHRLTQPPRRVQHPRRRSPVPESRGR